MLAREDTAQTPLRIRKSLCEHFSKPPLANGGCWRDEIGERDGRDIFTRRDDFSEWFYFPIEKSGARGKCALIAVPARFQAAVMLSTGL